MTTTDHDDHSTDPAPPTGAFSVILDADEAVEARLAEIPGDELVFVATSDIAAVTKGRAMRAADFSPRTSIGWVPANLGIGSLGHIVEGIPFGSSGDLRMRPDLSSLTRVPAIGDAPAVTIAFADIVETDGRPWTADPRGFLRRTIDDLEREFGIHVNAAFEHEFTALGEDAATHPFSLRAHRALGGLGAEAMDVLDRMGAEPECWLPEYGRHQYELTVRPAPALHAADRAILVRDTVRAVFDANGRRVTFSPVVEPGAGGTGVHVHFGLHAADGSTLVYDASRPGRISELAGRFAAGIVRHSPAMALLFAPLVISYDRLAPHNWSTARAFLGLQNREALLRITPTNELDGRDPAPQLHFEFRGGDIGANPWLLLGSVLRAGLEGLRAGLEPAEVIEGELDLEGRHRDLAALPASLDDAIDRFEGDETVRSWFSPEFAQTLIAIKRDESARLRGSSVAEQCRAYADIY